MRAPDTLHDEDTWFFADITLAALPGAAMGEAGQREGRGHKGVLCLCDGLFHAADAVPCHRLAHDDSWQPLLYYG